MKLASFFQATVSLLLVGNCNSLSASSSSSSKRAKSTIAVCTGPDCRVDDASDCLRLLQKSVAALSDDEALIRATGRSCIGPCGDGPCVMILDENNQKVVEKQDSKVAISLAPPDMFASDPKGWYQVRTFQQVDEVMKIACKSAGVVPFDTSKNATGSKEKELAVQSTRQVYDRPRNERKALQRLMQALVLLGFYGVENPGELEYSIAFGLFVLSNFIMKENIMSLVWRKIK